MPGVAFTVDRNSNTDLPRRYFIINLSKLQLEACLESILPYIPTPSMLYKDLEAKDVGRNVRYAKLYPRSSSWLYGYH